MRIAVSGTHCCGKSTLVDEFLLAHPNYAHEPEPYTALVEDYGEEFSADPCVDDFYRQLEFNVDRISHHSSGERVIYERSPVDFLAYILALKDLKRDEVDSGLFKTALGLVVGAIRNLDLIVFLPVDDAECIDVPDSEDPKLRKAVDARLIAILDGDEFGVVSSGNTAVVEARGSTAQRLRMLENAMQSTPTL
jgi:hypothetical protein